MSLTVALADDALAEAVRAQVRAPCRVSDAAFAPVDIGEAESIVLVHTLADSASPLDLRAEELGIEHLAVESAPRRANLVVIVGTCSPEEVAQAIAYLVGAKAVSGQVIVLGTTPQRLF